MKKKVVFLLFLIVVVLCLIFIAVDYFSTPAPLVTDADNLKIYTVCIVNSEYKKEEITDIIDCNKLAQIISSYSRSRLPHSFAPYQLSIGEIEIDIMDNNKTLHIILGDINVIYDSGDKGGYTIYNSDQLKDSVLQLIQ